MYILFFCILFMLIHFIADFAFQSEYMAINKNPKNNPDSWYVVMYAHCFIHSGLLFLFTGSIILFVVEFILHFFIDYIKCKDLISFREDQGLHVLCKIFYGIIYSYVSII